jgi:hypothetical protein
MDAVHLFVPGADAGVEVARPGADADDLGHQLGAVGQALLRDGVAGRLGQRGEPEQPLTLGQLDALAIERLHRRTQAQRDASGRSGRKLAGGQRMPFGIADAVPCRPTQRRFVGLEQQPVGLRPDMQRCPWRAAPHPIHA